MKHLTNEGLKGPLSDFDLALEAMDLARRRIKEGDEVTLQSILKELDGKKKEEESV